MKLVLHIGLTTVKKGNDSYNMKKSICRLISAALLIIAVITGGAGILTWILLRPEKEVYQITEGPDVFSDDGVRLKAVQKAGQNSHRWVILVHGYRADHSMMNEYARIYRENGFNTLQPDNRAHGSSGGDCIGMGYYDAADILKWISYITESDPDAEITLHGNSMGAAALMILSDNTKLPKNVKAIVADSGYTSALDYVRVKLKNTTVIPEMMSWFADVFYGYSLKEASPLEHVGHSRIPILFIHGKKDVIVPVENAYRLYETAGCAKDLYICEDAGHGESVFLDSAQYWDKVFSFIDEHGEPTG